MLISAASVLKGFWRPGYELVLSIQVILRVSRQTSPEDRHRRKQSFAANTKKIMKKATQDCRIDYQELTEPKDPSQESLNAFKEKPNLP